MKYTDMLFKNTLLSTLIIRVLQRIARGGRTMPAGLRAGESRMGFETTVIPGINGFILACLLMAGLWPFRFIPKNHCRIDEQSGALDFYGSGLAYFEYDHVLSGVSAEYFTIRMEIEPSNITRYAAGVLTMYTPAGEYLTIRQWKSLLLFRMGDKEVGLKLNMEQPGPTLFTIVMTPETLTVRCNDATRVMARPSVQFSMRHVTVVLGNSGAANHPWYGKIHYLSIHPGISKGDTLAQSGLVWPPQNIRSTQVQIPRYMFPLRPEILVPPWVDFKADRHYYIDVIVNFAGFIPAGFFLCALLSIYSSNRRKNIAVTFVTTLLISLFIELAQVMLPTRSSQLSDVLLNSTGGVTGAFAFVQIRSFLKNICGRFFKGSV